MRRAIVRRTSAAALLGLVYGLCAGVIWAAYHEFGSQSLRDRTPLVVADPTPHKLLPQDRPGDGPASSRGRTELGSPAEELGDAAQLARPTGEIRPAIAGRSDAEQAKIDPPGADGKPGGAREGTGADRVVDDPMPEGWSRAAVPGTRDELETAALPEAAPAAEELPASAVAALSPPTPAFKSHEVIPPAVVAEAARATPGASEAPPRGVTRAPVPSFKPVVDPSVVRRELARAPTERTAASSGRALPEALRAFWTNLKILLASAPASSDLHAGRDGSSGNGGATTASGSSGSASGGGSSSGSSSSGSSSSGSSSGGSSSSGGGSSGGSGTSASSGGDGSSAGRGGNGGRGRGDGARGGRGDNDRGGRGGRGGDDDDDDDDDDD